MTFPAIIGIIIVIFAIIMGVIAKPRILRVDVLFRDEGSLATLKLFQFTMIGI